MDALEVRHGHQARVDEGQHMLDWPLQAYVSGLAVHKLVAPQRQVIYETAIIWVLGLDFNMR